MWFPQCDDFTVTFNHFSMQYPQVNSFYLILSGSVGAITVNEQVLYCSDISLQRVPCFPENAKTAMTLLYLYEQPTYCASDNF